MLLIYKGYFEGKNKKKIIFVLVSLYHFIGRLEKIKRIKYDIPGMSIILSSYI